MCTCRYVHRTIKRSCEARYTKGPSNKTTHRTLQRVPLNTRYTFKQSSMFNGVGINCSYVHFACVRADTRYTFKQSSMLSGVGINCSYVHFACVRAVRMSLCARVSSRRASHVCAHRTLQRVPLNTRYTFKQSSMLNVVGINCSYRYVHV